MRTFHGGSVSELLHSWAVRVGPRSSTGGSAVRPGACYEELRVRRAGDGQAWWSFQEELRGHVRGKSGQVLNSSGRSPSAQPSSYILLSGSSVCLFLVCCRSAHDERNTKTIRPWCTDCFSPPNPARACASICPITGGKSRPSCSPGSRMSWCGPTAQAPVSPQRPGGKCHRSPSRQWTASGTARPQLRTNHGRY